VRVWVAVKYDDGDFVAVVANRSDLPKLEQFAREDFEHQKAEYASDPLLNLDDQEWSRVEVEHDGDETIVSCYATYQGGESLWTAYHCTEHEVV
jgi:hypothetical protein